MKKLLIILLLVSCSKEDVKVYTSLEGKWKCSNSSITCSFEVQDVAGVLKVTSGSFKIGSNTRTVLEETEASLSSILLQEDGDNYVVFKGLTLQTNSNNYNKLRCSGVDYSINGSFVSNDLTSLLLIRD